MNTAETANALAELQVKRKWAIKLRNKLMNSTRALARRYCGFAWDVAEEDREKVNKRAASIVDRALAGKEQHEDDIAIVNMMAAELDLLSQTLALYEQRRDDIDLGMKELVRQLPAWQWAKNVAGLGEIGLAVLIGEAGDLSKYRNIRGLWKRLGLAPFEKNGETRAMSQWHGNQLDADEWIACGYSGKRRAEIYACVGESLAKHQLRSAKKEGTDFAGAKGPYGRDYVERRNRCIIAHPDWSRGHLHNDAMRIMTKAVIKDLWHEWCAAEGIELQPDHWREAAQ